MAEAILDGPRLRTEEMVLNMGPHHPSTHGVLRFVLTTDGEVVTRCVPDVGYLHRSIEKIAELVPYSGFMPYTDRVDYVAAMNCNVGYAMTVEKLLGLEVPERAEFLRVVVGELNRISSHLVAVGAMPTDWRAATPFVHALRERETINDLFEMLCGARLTYNYVRIGGVSFDLPPGFTEKTAAFLDHFESMMRSEFDPLISQNLIYRRRLAGVAPISAATAIAYGLSGPNLRASGLDWDLRRDEPYSIYPKLEFDVVVGTGEVGVLGDCFDRYAVRVGEMLQSVRIVRQCLERMPDGPVMAKVPRTIKPPTGEAFVRTEAPRGELGYFLVADGSDRAYRCKIRTGSFASMSILEALSPGWMIADLVAIIAAFDVVAPEIDR